MQRVSITPLDTNEPLTTSVLHEKYLFDGSELTSEKNISIQVSNNHKEIIPKNIPSLKLRVLSADNLNKLAKKIRKKQRNLVPKTVPAVKVKVMSAKKFENLEKKLQQRCYDLPDLSEEDSEE